MKQHSGEEIRAIMTEMPAATVAELQAAHSDLQITEYEARWWGYLMFARTGAYEGLEYKIVVSGTREEVVRQFQTYVVEERAGNARYGLVRRSWPDSGLDREAAV